jgi:hypothetical protein
VVSEGHDSEAWRGANGQGLADQWLADQWLADQWLTDQWLPDHGLGDQVLVGRGWLIMGRLIIAGGGRLAAEDW